MNSQSLETGQEKSNENEALAELDRLRQYHERIQSLERIRNQADAEVEEKKLELKEAKDYAKSCEKNLQRAIRGDDQQKELPFKEGEPAAEASQEEDQSWREVTIEDAGIPEKLCAFLRENKPPIETLGDLADWTSKYQLTDINGIGPAKATQIDEAMDRFWETYRPNGETPEDEGEEDAEDDAGDEEEENG